MLWPVNALRAHVSFSSQQPLVLGLSSPEQRSMFPRTRPCVAEAHLGLTHTPAPSLSTFISAAVTAWGFLCKPRGLPGRAWS